MDFETLVPSNHLPAVLSVLTLTTSRYDYYRAHGVAYHWAAGTAVSTAVMGIAFAFIVVEWCTQSHQNTENYEDAMQGLRRTRRFKKYTAWLRGFPNLIIAAAKRGWFIMLMRRTQRGVGERRSLVWTWQTKDEEEMLPVIEGERLEDQQYKTVQAHIVVEEASTEGLSHKPPDSARHGISTDYGQ